MVEDMEEDLEGEGEEVSGEVEDLEEAEVEHGAIVAVVVEDLEGEVEVLAAAGEVSKITTLLLFYI